MVGQRVSHYQILERLGQGGMGVVYKALDTKLDRGVALKFLSTSALPTDDDKARFVREAKAAASLSHPNICTIHEIDETEDGQAFIAMEYVEGETLKQKIARGLLPVAEALDYAVQIAQGLSKAHEVGIIHRDVKPANVMVTKEGVVKIVDFGLAKVAEQTQLTKRGTTLGTVAYMSPEQARGEEVDAQTDIWSLGVVLYEMLSGERPFRGDYEQAVIYSILNVDPKPVRTLRPEVLGRVLARTLAKDAAARYTDANALLSDLRTLESQRASSVPAPEQKPVPSIAVLPFADMSPQRDQEYFCDGMAEEIVNALTQVGNLHVVARTSAFSFKGQQIDVREIGRKLCVKAVLEGSVRKAGNRLRITAQLINVATGYHLWSEKYDRDLEDLFAIQDEISLAVVDELKIKLLGDEKKALVKRHTDNLEAYTLYLKGRYYFSKQNPGGFEKAIEYFEQAIEKDPQHAVAFAGLADAYWHSSFFGNMPPRQTYPKAREAAKKAIEIDETLGEGHASLASIYTYYDWDFEAAEREFKRALELASGSSYTRVNYSLYLSLKRRHDEAVAQAKKAQEFDPLSRFSNTHLGHTLWQARRYDEAIEEFEKWLVIEPNDWYAHLHLGVLYQEKGMIEEAIAEIEKGVELSGGVAMCVVNAIMTHFRFGSRDVAERLFDDLKERATHEYIPPMCFIYVHLVRGETDQAFEWARKAYEERDSFLVWLRVTPLDSLHLPREPRIDELLDRLGLP